MGVIFFTATLAISIVGLVFLVALKRWELKTGRVLSVAARPAVTESLERASLWLEYHAPSFARRLAGRASRWVAVQVHRAAAYAVLLFEKSLERVLELVRHKTQVSRGDTEASAFLREVSAHKKALQELSRGERPHEE